MTRLDQTRMFAWAVCLSLAIATSFPAPAAGQQRVPPKQQAAPETNPEQGDAGQTGDAEQTEAEKEKALVAELTQELDKLDARINGTDEQADARHQIVEGLRQELEQEYISNHVQLVALRKAEAAGRQDEALTKLERRQKIIAMYLVELDARSVDVVGFDSDLYRELVKFHQRPDVRNRQALQQRTMTLIRNISERRVRKQRKKTIAEVTAPLVGADHLAPEAPSAAPEYPAATDGLLQDYRDHIKRLIRIKWDGAQLALDYEHWDAPFAGKTEVDVIGEVESLLTDRGFKTNLQAIKGRQLRARPRLVTFRGGHVGSNLSRIFRAMEEPTTHRQSSTGNSNGRERLVLRTDSMEARLVRSDDVFTFDFSEEDQRWASLRVRQDGERGLAVDSLGDVSLRFRQSPDGAIKVVELTDDETFQFTADSFAAFYRQNTDYCEGRLLPLFDHLGITTPMSRMDRRVMRCALAELRVLADGTTENAGELIKRLSHNEYARREEASRRLGQSLGYYAAALQAALDGPLPIESQMRIKSLLHGAKRSQTQQIVAELRLLADADYLKMIRDDCSDADQELVEDQIQQLAGTVRAE